MLQGYVDACDDGLLSGWASRTGTLDPVSLEVVCEGAIVGCHVRRQAAPTPVAHVLRDYCGGTADSRRRHYDEWVRLVENLTGEDVTRRATDLEHRRYPIHFHVWSPMEFMVLLDALERLMPAGFDVDFFKANRTEGVWILRRTERPHQEGH